MPGIVQTLPIIHSFPILKVGKLRFKEGNVQNQLIGNKQEKHNQNSDSWTPEPPVLKRCYLPKRQSLI